MILFVVGSHQGPTSRVASTRILRQSSVQGTTNDKNSVMISMSWQNTKRHVYNPCGQQRAVTGPHP